MNPRDLSPTVVDHLPVSGGVVETRQFVTAEMRQTMNLPESAKFITFLKRQTPLPLRREGWMPDFVFDSNGQAWAVGSYGGQVYKTQAPIPTLHRQLSYA